MFIVSMHTQTHLPWGLLQHHVLFESLSSSPIQQVELYKYHLQHTTLIYFRTWVNMGSANSAALGNLQKAVMG